MKIFIIVDDYPDGVVKVQGVFADEKEAIESARKWGILGNIEVWEEIEVSEGVKKFVYKNSI